MKKEYRSYSETDTGAIAAELAAALPLGSVIALHGDLGAGKTVFARAFARALGIAEHVSSPTFTIVQEYSFSKGVLFHLDLYRIDNSDAALAFGIDEFLCEPEAVSLIEWPERIADILPPETLHISIARTGVETERLFTIGQGE